MVESYVADPNEENVMSKMLTAIAAAGAALMLAVVAPQPAEAQNNGAAFLGGLIVGGALNAARPPVYAPAPTYVAPPVYQPVCTWQNQRYYDPYTGWGYRRVQVCQ